MYSPAFWSQTEVSQSAASAAGVAPPITNPKKRPLEDATTPGSAAVASAATTSRASSGRSGSGPPSAARISARLARLVTGRAGSPSRYASACSNASPNGRFQSGASTRSSLVGLAAG
jgi:hypothetical protein